MPTTRRLLVLILALAARAAAADAPDPRLWLEDIDSPRSLAWVRQRDDKTLAELKSDPRWAGVETDARSVVLAEDRIPWPELRGRWLYNFWQDPKSVRGLWRRTTPAEYKKPNPRWETVLDLDALAAAEKENWVWKSADCLQPEQSRCLLTLSRGGGDASVIREFDADRKEFVAGGFALPEAKSDVAWLDADELPSAPTTARARSRSPATRASSSGGSAAARSPRRRPCTRAASRTSRSRPGSRGGPREGSRSSSRRRASSSRANSCSARTGR